MRLWKGHWYHDDRLFVLDIVLAKKGSGRVWAVITRRNCTGYPPVRVDEFDSREDAQAYVKEVEPITPLISHGGSARSPTPSYAEYITLLREDGLRSALEVAVEDGAHFPGDVEV